MDVMDVSKSPDYSDFVWAVGLTRYGLEILGLWPKTDENFKEKFSTAFRVAFISIIIFVNCIAFVSAVLRVWGDIILTAENLQLTLPIAASLLKLCILRWKQATILSNLQMIMEDWMALKLETEKNVMMRQGRFTRILTIYGYIFAMFTVILIIVAPLSTGILFRNVTDLVDRDRILPLQAYYYYDTDKSPQYEFTIITQCLVTFYSVLLNVTVDAFLGLMIFHICGQMENYRHRIGDLILDKDFNNALQKHVNTHLRLIRFVENIENIFTYLTLVLVLYYSMMCCLFGFLFFELINNKLDNTSLSRMSLPMLGMFGLFIYTLLYCGAGELLVNQSEAIYRAICDLEWYKLDYKKRRNLILLMIRADDAFHITAGKIIPLSMATFCSLLKTSLGYISFLITRHQG